MALSCVGKDMTPTPYPYRHVLDSALPAALIGLLDEQVRELERTLGNVMVNWLSDLLLTRPYRLSPSAISSRALARMRPVGKLFFVHFNVKLGHAYLKMLLRIRNRLIVYNRANFLQEER